MSKVASHHLHAAGGSSNCTKSAGPLSARKNPKFARKSSAADPFGANAADCRERRIGSLQLGPTIRSLVTPLQCTFVHRVSRCAKEAHLGDPDANNSDRIASYRKEVLSGTRLANSSCDSASVARPMLIAPLSYPRRMDNPTRLRPWLQHQRCPDADDTSCNFAESYETAVTSTDRNSEFVHARMSGQTANVS